jgi:hypothetical protein
MKKIKYLEENIGALEVKFTKEENVEIREAIADAEVSGDRYPAAMMAFNFMDTPVKGRSKKI